MGVEMGPPVGQVFPSPLRYPGGKRKLANFIKLVMLENELIGSEYAEPYAGGASVALSLLYEEYADHVHINDLNRSIFSFWKIALEQPDELCSRIASVRVNVDEWNRQRAIQDATDPEELDLAFSTFFLNRTSRSGVIGGGIIGGRDQRGAWKIDARFNRQDLIRRIEKIARFRTRITVTGMDAAEYLRSSLPGEALVYLDPPYYAKGADLYQSFYRHQDHVEICGLVLELAQPWIVSYDAVPEIKTLYRGSRSLEYDLHYSAANRYRGSEVMFFQKGLRVPRTPAAASVSYRAVDQARSAA